jgi:hypothetical protein
VPTASRRARVSGAGLALGPQALRKPPCWQALFSCSSSCWLTAPPLVLLPRQEVTELLELVRSDAVGTTLLRIDERKQVGLTPRMWYLAQEAGRFAGKRYLLAGAFLTWPPSHYYYAHTCASVVGVSVDPSVVGRDWSPVSSNKARGYCCRTPGEH